MHSMSHCCTGNTAEEKKTRRKTERDKERKKERGGSILSFSGEKHEICGIYIEFIFTADSKL